MEVQTHHFRKKYEYPRNRKEASKYWMFLFLEIRIFFQSFRWWRKIFLGVIIQFFRKKKFLPKLGLFRAIASFFMKNYLFLGEPDEIHPPKYVTSLELLSNSYYTIDKTKSTWLLFPINFRLKHRISWKVQNIILLFAKKVSEKANNQLKKENFK